MTDEEKRTVVRRCDALNCVWNADRRCEAREILITISRRGLMSCWNYMDARERAEEER